MKRKRLRHERGYAGLTRRSFNGVTNKSLAPSGEKIPRCRDQALITSGRRVSPTAQRLASLRRHLDKRRMRAQDLDTQIDIWKQNKKTINSLSFNMISTQLIIVEQNKKWFRVSARMGFWPGLFSIYNFATDRPLLRSRMNRNEHLEERNVMQRAWKCRYHDATSVRVIQQLAIHWAFIVFKWRSCRPCD